MGIFLSDNELWAKTLNVAVDIPSDAYNNLVNALNEARTETGRQIREIIDKFSRESHSPAIERSWSVAQNMPKLVA